MRVQDYRALFSERPFQIGVLGAGALGQAVVDGFLGNLL
jgi:hypothetical protein